MCPKMKFIRFGDLKAKIAIEGMYETFFDEDDIKKIT